MSAQYEADSIQILEGLEAVRVRPGMYIGGTNTQGLTHLLWEIVDNAVDEKLAGYCDTIEVTLQKDDSVIVSDNGRGIPVGIHPKANITAERVVFTTLHAGGKFNKNIYSVSSGLHGVGSSVVNALSEWFEVEIHKDGKLYYDRYENGGNPVVKLKNGKLEPKGTTDKTGTTVRFKPDPQIFPEIKFNTDTIKKKLSELSYLNPGLKLIFKNEQTGEKEEYLNNNGIKDFLNELLREKKPLHDIIYFTQIKEDITCDIAMVYTQNYDESIFSFVNNVNTISGGTHESGFKLALTRIINTKSRELNLLKEKEENFRGEDVREGILAIINIKLPEPQFEGQTKAKLGNPEAQAAVSDIIYSNLDEFFDRNPNILKTISAKAQEAKKSREASKKAKEIIRNKSNRATIVSKLASCSKGTSPEQRELFIVEGDSAGGSAKQARDRSFQAILPLKGKILNVEKTNLSKLLDNNEVQAIISSINTGIGDEFTLEDLNYHKIIIATDADVDGAHIRTLLLTFFYRHMKQLVTEGYIYIAMPPLYKVTYRKKEPFYVYNEEELNRLTSKYKGKPSIQRFKGLGEMTATQLWETTLNPSNRLLKKINISDAIEADEITETLMGNIVNKRKIFIENFSTNADIDL